jgi:hypothetical protein
VTAADRLAKVRVWWDILKQLKPSDPRYSDVVAAIRKEAEAFVKDEAEERKQTK